MLEREFLSSLTAVVQKLTETNGNSWDNKINIIDLMNPPKEEALAYMAGEGEAPARVAKVIINCSSVSLLSHRDFADPASHIVKATEEPYDEEFLVELPITESTVAVPADKYTTKGELRSWQLHRSLADPLPSQARPRFATTMPMTLVLSCLLKPKPSRTSSRTFSARLTTPSRTGASTLFGTKTGR